MEEWSARTLCHSIVVDSIDERLNIDGGPRECIYLAPEVLNAHLTLTHALRRATVRHDRDVFCHQGGTVIGVLGSIPCLWSL